LLLVRHVDGDRNRSTAALLYLDDRLTRGRLVHVGRDDNALLGRKQARDCAADAGAGAGDEADPVC